MKIATHLKINSQLCGQPLLLADKNAQVGMLASPAMAADEQGLVHGGFIFGMADYAAMLAVNHPYVVLGNSSCAFQKPVKVGDELVATANISESSGRKHLVRVEVTRGHDLVFSGQFTCFVLDKHVLSA